MYDFSVSANLRHKRKTPPVAKKRTDGEGTVFPLKRYKRDGTPYTVYWAARKIVLDNEQRKVTAQGKTPGEAIQRREDKIVKLMVEHQLLPPSVLPPDPQRGPLTVGDCLMDWLSEKRGQKLSQATMHMYDARIRNHLLPAFGSTLVRSLTYGQIKHFFSVTLPDKGLGEDSIRQTFICLRSALDHYLRDRHILVHPMVGLKAPAKKGKTRETVEQVRSAAEFLGPRLMPLAIEHGHGARWFLGLMGLRQGEALGMTDSSLIGGDDENGYRITVKQQLQRETPRHGCELDQANGKWSCGESSTSCPKKIGSTRWVLKEAKTESGHRDLIISAEGWKVLIDHRDSQRAKRKLKTFHPEPGPGLDTLLFTREDGRPIYAQRDRKELTGLVEAIPNLPDSFTVHTLRHIATTVLIESGIERDQLISIMGWSGKSADAQIAIYSSADRAKSAASASSAYATGLFKQ